MKKLLLLAALLNVNTVFAEIEDGYENEIRLGGAYFQNVYKTKERNEYTPYGVFNFHNFDSAIEINKSIPFRGQSG